MASTTQQHDTPVLLETDDNNGNGDENTILVVGIMVCQVSALNCHGDFRNELCTDSVSILACCDMGEARIISKSRMRTWRQIYPVS